MSLISATDEEDQGEDLLDTTHESNSLLSPSDEGRFTRFTSDFNNTCTYINFNTRQAVLIRKIIIFYSI